MAADPVQIILAVATLVTAVGGAAAAWNASHKSTIAIQKADETNAKVDLTIAKVEEVHKSTNGLSARNEAIAKKLGIAEGTAAEKDKQAKGAT